MDVAKLKAEAVAQYNEAAGMVTARTPELQASYDRIVSDVKGRQAAREGEIKSADRERDADMQTFIQNLNISPVGFRSRAGRASQSLLGRERALGGAYGNYFGALKGTATAGNQSVADMLRRMGEERARELDQMARMGGGGGGGGGRGRRGRGRRGGGSGSEEGVYPDWVEPLADPLVRGAAATGARYTKQAEGFRQAGLVGPGSAQTYGERLRQGMLKKQPTRRTTTRRRSGKSRSF